MKSTRKTDPLACKIPKRMPVLMLKSTISFPMAISNVRLSVGENLAILKAFPGSDTLIAAALLIEPESSYAPSNIAPVAMVSRILSRIRMPDGTAQVVLQGLRRVRILSFAKTKPYLFAEVEPFVETTGDTARVSALIEEVIKRFEKLVSVEPRFPEELLKVLRLNRNEGGRFADLIPTLINFTYQDKRRLIEEGDVARRLEIVSDLLQQEIARSLVARDVEKKTVATIEKSQREAYLREQLEVIREELGEQDPLATEIAELEERIRQAKLPQEAQAEALNEVVRMRSVGPRASEASVIRTYLDWVLALPWNESTKDRFDLKKARKELDRNHYGLEDVKQRILEFLAVRKLGGSGKGSVLCIIGPPGTGKTTLGYSIANAIGRKCVRLSVGGVHDESEIRGHRRTYVGAMPGRIVQSLRRAGSNNPVMIIDEIDKMERGPHGDPSSALLEVLDPSQNASFLDHFLGVPFDLSQVFFVATANLDDFIPAPLLDRMEIISLAGYTEPEKFWIAKKHLWPKALDDHGLKGRGVRISDAALHESIRRYTQEAGVRELTRTLETVCRKISSRIAQGKSKATLVDVAELRKLLGPAPYLEGAAEKRPEIGVATGLAWTASGGDLLFIEAIKMPGEGKITVTGSLGDVMRESVMAAYSFVRSQALDLQISPEAFQAFDIHIHFPAGAIPKDGPSAGITIATTIASLLSGRPIRHDVAMTGEISLRGKVLPVGGIKEKTLAAYRARIPHVILPKANQSDLQEIPKEVREKLRFHFVERVREVFAIALGSASSRARAAKTELSVSQGKAARGKKRS